MKNTVYTLMIFILFISCSNKPKEKIDILTSFYPMEIFTLNIIKDTPLKSNVLIDLNAGCPHEYSFTANDINKIEKAKIFIMNGLIEHIGENIASEINKDAIILKSADGLFSITNKNAVNEHTWVSIKNAVKQSENIKNALVKYYPEYQNIFEKNFFTYKEKLLHLAIEFTNALTVKKDTITIGGSFSYLFKDLGINILYDIEDDMNSLNPKSIVAVKEYIKDKKNTVIFSEAEYENIAKVLSKEIDVPYYILDIVSEGDTIEIDTYQNVMKENIIVLKEAFEK